MANYESPKVTEKHNEGLYDDERTQNRIHEHLNNKDDVITEQDIANIGTPVVEEDELRKLAELQDKKEELEESKAEEFPGKINDNEDPAIETPWNILGG